MLRRITVNKQVIPVPVPIQNLADVFHWISETFIDEKSNKSLTRISLDGNIIEADINGYIEGADKILLKSDSVVEVQLETPFELSLQALDTMGSLASAVLEKFKPLAVECWQAKSNSDFPILTVILEDIELLLDLVDHMKGLLADEKIDLGGICGAAHMLKKTQLKMELAISNSDWRACARLLLNRGEGFLKSLAIEVKKLENRIIAAECNKKEYLQPEMVKRKLSKPSDLPV